MDDNRFEQNIESQLKDGLLDASVNATKLGFGMEDVAGAVDSLTTNFGFGLEDSIFFSELLYFLLYSAKLILT